MIPTQKQIDNFNTCGVVAIPDVIPKDQLKTMAEAVDLAVASRSEGDNRSLDEMSSYEQSFTQCINLWETDMAVRKFTFNSDLAELSAALLDVDKTIIWHDQALYKKPGARHTDPHQDLPFWPISGRDHITAWIPFNGSKIGSGAMSYLGGSHRSGIKKFGDITGKTTPFDYLSHPAAKNLKPLTIETDPGTVVFHHSLTVHWADSNLSSEARRVYCIIYFPDGCTYSKPWPHLIPDRRQMKLGEAYASDLNPVTWPTSKTLPNTPFGTPPTTGFE
ncbi:MAG: hypothetical protein GWP30_11565 [Actinobacteria bacterium]|nr:hypothetical protein [Actinomycetota bacterium]